MPLPPKLLVAQDGKPKRRKVTAIVVFTRHLKESQPDLRGLSMSDMSLIRTASEAFDRLPLDEQRRYEQVAKAENRRYDQLFGDQFRRDCEGAPLTERGTAASERLEFDAYVDELVASLAGRATKIEDLVQTEFVVGEVFSFVDADDRLDKGVYVPAEFGFVRFSLAKGVTGYVHCIVQPRVDAIPTYLTSQCKDHSAETHQIPTYGCPYADESMGRFCIALKALCARGGADGGQALQLPIFVPAERLVAMQKALKYAYSDPVVVAEGCPFVREINRAKATKVFPYEKLFVAVMNSQCLPQASRKPGLLAAQVTRELNRESFTGEAHGCELHKEQDNLPNCAQLRAHSHAWTLLRFAAEPYALSVGPAHGPTQLEADLLPRPVKANWLTRGSRGNASCPNRLGSWQQAPQPQQRRMQPWQVPRPSSATSCSASASVAASLNDDAELENLSRMSVSSVGGSCPVPSPSPPPPAPPAPPKPKPRANLPALRSFAGAVGDGSSASDNGVGVGGFGAAAGGAGGRGRGRGRVVCGPTIIVD